MTGPDDLFRELAADRFDDAFDVLSSGADVNGFERTHRFRPLQSGESGDGQLKTPRIRQKTGGRATRPCDLEIVEDTNATTALRAGPGAAWPQNARPLHRYT